MAMFEFCQECIALGELAYDDIVKMCSRCFRGRREYIRQIKRDKAYRSHIARQMAGYPCDASSGCPHHPPTYQFYTPPAERFYEYGELIKKALAEFERVSHSSITALELLSGDYLSLVRYCDSCYNRAVDGIEQNLKVSLCNGCLTRRESYINDVHGHQDSFLEPLEIARWSPGPKGCVLGLQISWAKSIEYDDFLRATELSRVGGGGPPDPFTVVGLVFAGLAAPALVVSLASVIYSRRQWRLAQEARGNGQAILILSRLCSDLTNGRATITRQDVENASTSSFHTAETHPE
jgi:hypothetical protein